MSCDDLRAACVGLANSTGLIWLPGKLDANNREGVCVFVGLCAEGRKYMLIACSMHSETLNYAMLEFLVLQCLSS